MAIQKSSSFNYRNLMSFTAGADLSKSKYRFVKLNNDGEVVPELCRYLCGAHENTIGVVIIPGKQDEVVSVLTQPGTKCVIEVGATSDQLPPGTRVTTAASGKALPQGSGKTDNNLHHGVILEDGIKNTDAKAGKYVTILFLPNTGPAA